MNLTFGVITAFEDLPRLTEVVNSILVLNVPNSEILMVGSYPDTQNSIPTFPGVKNLMCDGWITHKKNLIARLAEYETLVLLHDYFVLDPSWYQAYQEFGYDWDVCSNPQYLIGGQRHFTDWVMDVGDTDEHGNARLPMYYSLNYDDWTHTQRQYISGGFFLVKRQLLRDNPLNEEMKPGSPEDLEWSRRIRDNAVIKCNRKAIVRHNKVHRDELHADGKPYHPGGVAIPS
jgi:hypothetical protein